MVDAPHRSLLDVLDPQALEDQADKVFSSACGLTLDEKMRPGLIAKAEAIAAKYWDLQSRERNILDAKTKEQIGKVREHGRALLEALESVPELVPFHADLKSGIRHALELTEQLQKGVKSKGVGGTIDASIWYFYLEMADWFEGLGGEVKPPYPDGEGDTPTHFGDFAADWLRVIDPDREPPRTMFIRSVIDGWSDAKS